MNSDAALAQARVDAARMREFLRSEEWACFQKYLQAAIDDNIAYADALPSDRTDEILHYRSVRLGMKHALRVPALVIDDLDKLAAWDEHEQKRQQQAGRRRTR